jgi:Zn finger protein HypA/HybF involved in hydrogenase expression
MKLKCKKCKLEWEYTGKKKPAKTYSVFTSCPRCKSNVKLEDR